MITVFLYSIMCYGISSAFVYYSGPFDIFSKLRDFLESNHHEKLSELFSCMFCLPVNIGIIMSLICLLFCPGQPFTPFNIVFDGNTNLWPLTAIFDGFYTGAIVSLIDSFVNFVETSRNGENNKILID